MLKHRRTWLGIGLSVLCLALILWHVDLKQVWEATLVADWRAWSVVVVAYMGFMLLRAWRWQMILGNGARYWPVFHAQSIGYLLLSILPFRIGDLGRAYLVGQQPGSSSSRALSSVVLERVLDMLVIVVLFTLTLPFVPTLPHLLGRAGLTFGTLAIVCFGLLLVAASRRLHALKLTKWVLQRIPWLETEAWLKRADSFLAGFQTLTGWGLLLPVLGLSVAVWLAGVVAYYWGIGAFWPEVTWPASAFVLCAAAFGLSVPSSPSGVGVFHASIWLALPVFSATKAQALGFAFVYHALTLIIVFILGGIGLWQNGQTIGDILTATRRFVVRRQSAETTT